jgi:hypothetical protein
MGLEQIATRIVRRVTSVSGGQQHARIDQQRQRPNPSASRSSASAAVR